VSRKHVEAIARTPTAKLVAVCDVQMERARELGRRLDVPCFSDMEAMFAAVPTIEVASILTPTGHHAEHAVRAAAHGKHVIVEKPIALRVEDADAMIGACERAGVKLLVVKPARYNPPIQRLRRALDDGRFGKMVLGTVRLRWCRMQDYYDGDAWRGKSALDGGVLANQASHYIDLLLWMLGPVESVCAMVTTRLVEIESEDTAAAVLRFASGALGIIEATTATRPTDLEGSLSVLGERGSVVIGGFAVSELITWNFTDQPPEDHPTYNESGHHAFIRDVVRCIQGDDVHLVDGREARKAIELIAAIQEASRTGRTVRLTR